MLPTTEDVDRKPLSDRTRVIISILLYGALLWLLTRFQDPPERWGLALVVLISAASLPWHIEALLHRVVAEEEKPDEDDVSSPSVPDDLSTLEETRARREVDMADLEDEFDVRTDGEACDDD
jgi:hypothetical protein